MSFQSLHSHTINSDGKLNYNELLEAAGQMNISTVAFTDHDAVVSENTLKSLHSNVNWISGIEVSSGLPKKLGGGSNGPHIVGLFVDPTNTNLIEYCKRSQQARVERMETIVKNLQGLGFEISVDDCLQASGGEAIGRPHIVQALSSHPENENVTQKLLEKMRNDSTGNPEIEKQYQNIVTGSAHQIPYSLYLSETAYYDKVYVDKKFWTTLEDSVALIRAAGGLAFIAHYSTDKRNISYEILEELLESNSIDGVETVYGLWMLGTAQEGEIGKDKQVIKNLLEKHNKLPSGGADIHTIDDIESFTSNVGYASETVGMAENIITKSKVDTTWSSYR